MKTDPIHAPDGFPLMTGKTQEARAQPLLRYRFAGALVSLCLHGALLLMPWQATRDAGKDELLRVVMLAKDVQTAQHIRQEAARMDAETAFPVYPQEPAPLEPAQDSPDESPQGQLQEGLSQSLPAAPVEPSPSAMEQPARGLSDGAEITSQTQTGRQNVFRAPGSSLVSAGGVDPLRSRALGMKYTLQQHAGGQPEAMPQSASSVQTMVRDAGVAAGTQQSLITEESSGQTVLAGEQPAVTSSHLPKAEGVLQPLHRGEAVLPIKARSLSLITIPQAASQERRAPESSTQATASGALIFDGAPGIATAGADQTVPASGDTGSDVPAADGEDASVVLRLPAGEGAAFDHAPQSAGGGAKVEVQQAPAAAGELSRGLAGNLPRSEHKGSPEDDTVLPQEAHAPATSPALFTPHTEQTAQNAEVPTLSASSPPQPAYDDPAEIVTRIAELLRQHRTYPDAALRRKVEGLVQVALAIAPDGSLASAQLHKKSGSAVLDSAALALVRAIFPLRVRLAKPLAIIVPVEYRLPR